MIHNVCAFVPTGELKVSVALGLTVIVPVALVCAQVPVLVTVYAYTPAGPVGEPLIVITPPEKLPNTPAGKPLTVAPVPPPLTAYVILSKTSLIHNVCAFVPIVDVNEIKASGLTVMLKLCVAPTQKSGAGPVAVTVIVATTGKLVVF